MCTSAVDRSVTTCEHLDNSALPLAYSVQCCTYFGVYSNLVKGQSYKHKISVKEYNVMTSEFDFLFLVLAGSAT